MSDNRNFNIKLPEDDVDMLHKFMKEFDQEDSVCIFNIRNEKDITKFGYAKNEDELLLIV